MNSNGLFDFNIAADHSAEWLRLYNHIVAINISEAKVNVSFAA